VRRVRFTVALLLAGVVWAGPSAWATHRQGDVPSRRGREREGARARGPAARQGGRAGGAAVVAPAPPAGQSAWDLVWKSEAAAKRVSLRGRVRIMSYTGRETERAAAEVWAAGGKLRLDYESGRRRWSLIDDGRNLLQLRPKSRRALVLPRPALATDKPLAERNYVARVAGSASVAGRITQVVEIAPKSGGPPAWRLWLDGETAFALRRERYNTRGEVATSTEYFSVQFGAQVPPATFSLPNGWTKVESGRAGARQNIAALAAGVGFAIRPPRYLPPGYVLQGGYSQRQGKRRGASVPAAVELRYTDGIRLLSVFQREAKGEEARPYREQAEERIGKQRRGGGKTTSLTLLDRGGEKAVRYLGNSLAVLVVGELAEAELIRVAKGVEQNHDTRPPDRRR